MMVFLISERRTIIVNTYSIQKFRVSNLQITSTEYAANTLQQRILPREAIPSHCLKAIRWTGHVISDFQRKSSMENNRRESALKVARRNATTRKCVYETLCPQL